MAIILGPIIINRAKSKGIKQTERLVGAVVYEEKEGTPIMGGFIFIVPIIIIVALYVLRERSIILFQLDKIIFLLLSLISFSTVGYLDDHIKSSKARNMGLNEREKLIIQFIIALIMTIAWSVKYDSKIIIPFINHGIDIGYLYIPFMMLVIVGTVNSVNLLDGMDGLASVVCIIYFVFYVFLGFLWKMKYISIYSLIVIGGLLGFLIYNHNPAKIFMGDTGSMALGGIVAGLAVVSRTPLYIPLVGLIFLIEALSVMIQVSWYKRTKKRVFLMAPIHYHFQKMGLTEKKVVLLFGVVQLMLTLIGIFGL